MSNMSSAAINASESVFPSQPNLRNGSVDPLFAQKFYNEPIWGMFGGTSMTGRSGLTVDPARMSTDYETRMMYKIIQQSQSMVNTPRGNRFLNTFERDKIMGRDC